MYVCMYIDIFKNKIKITYKFTKIKVIADEYKTKVIKHNETSYYFQLD